MIPSFLTHGSREQKVDQMKLQSHYLFLGLTSVAALIETNTATTTQKTGFLQKRFAWLLLLCCSGLLYQSTASAQFNPIPLSGGTPVKMVADFQRPFIYVIQSPTSGATNGTLMFINTTNGALTKTMSIGSNPTDLTINVAEGKLYVASWGESATYVVDLTSQTLLTPLNLGTDIYRINAGRAGRIVAEGENQWVALGIVDTVGGTNVALWNYLLREGDGETDLSGTNYYHCDNNSTGAQLHKDSIAGDELTTLATGSIHAMGSRNLVL